MQSLSLPALLSARTLLPEETIQSCLLQARQQQLPFVSLLVRSTAVDTKRLAEAMADAFACPLFDLNALDPAWSPPSLAPGLVQELIQRRLLPLQIRGNLLYVAMADPSAAAEPGQQLQQAHLSLQPVIVELQSLEAALARLTRCGSADTADLATLLDDDIADEDPDSAASTNSSEEAPVVRFVNQVLRDAISQRASDVHIEPFEAWCRIRFRIDGHLQEITRVPSRFAPRLSSRLKVMAGLDITERRRPQDGRLSLSAGKNAAVDLRLSTLPVLWGEKIVLRILDSRGAIMALPDLGCLPQQLQHYQQALDRHQGLILVTGPTGSGKTITLYSGLAHLNVTHRNIATAEDPVEINLEGINQVAVNHRSGLDFATCLRAFLRQDPDVVMIGEIRDAETADMAIKAAQTGHLVLSTLHTNSAVETVSRLINMGIDPWNLASALSLVIAQRLVRRLCPYCRRADVFSEQEQQRCAGLPLPATCWRARGCKHCHQGYRGRVAIMEMLPVNAEISSLIGARCQPEQLSQLAQRAGWPSLNDSALLAVANGDTTVDEVLGILRGLSS
jgi:type IV pilus assembly protein PilB